MVLFEVSAGMEDSYHSVGVFSNRVKAELLAAEAEKIHGNASVREITVDAEVGRKAVPFWVASINMETGEITRPLLLQNHEWSDWTDWMNPDQWEHTVEEFTKLNQFDFYSLISQEAANELAMKAYHKYQTVPRHC